MFIIKTRIINEANYIIKNNATLRDAAKYFKLGKSTIHKDMNDKLKKIDVNLYIQVRNIMEEHIKIRHIKGGEVTKKRYKKMRA